MSRVDRTTQSDDNTLRLTLDMVKAEFVVMETTCINAINASKE